jgi:prepilin-type N-terminal cleavage/methylation domain-containing protein
MHERIRRARQDQSGFTLIELLIVIVILGILAAIVVFAVNGIQNRGTQAACKADVETVTVAAEAYDAQNGHYADSMQQLVDAGLLHSVPSTSNYTIDYQPNGNSVTVSSTTCPNDNATQSSSSSSIGPGSDPSSAYCVELGTALNTYGNIDLTTLDDETFKALNNEFNTLAGLAPNGIGSDWQTFAVAFQQIHTILRNSNLSLDDLRVLENGQTPDSLTPEQADQLRHDLDQPMNSQDFQNAGNDLGQNAASLCGLNMN